MRLAVLLIAVVCTGCAVPPPAPPRSCVPLPTLDKQPTETEFREYIQTLAALYAECAAR